MRPDRATRGFLTLLAVALLVGALVLCGALGGVLIPLLLSRLSGEGLDALPDRFDAARAGAARFS